MQALPEIRKKMTGKKITVCDLSSTQSLDLARVFLKCQLFQKEVEVGIWKDSMPVPGVDLILGNDLAGSMVVPPPEITKLPSNTTPTVVEDHLHPNIFPLCAVTRSQTPPSDSNVTYKFDLPNQLISRENLIKAQHDDLTLTNFHRLAVDTKEEVDNFPGYYYQDGILMRCNKPSDCSKQDSWAEVHQIVIPLSIRDKVIEIAHDGAGGHMGVSKTYAKIQDHFFCPSLKKSISEYVRSCHVCQIVGKPNQKIPQAPLNPIPVPDEPFDKIIIDCVGPLPKTKKGNQFILTVMCPVTRYPEAFPLKRINAKVIADTLLKFFTQVGLPKEIQSDRGTNFTSDLFASILKELGISQILSSAYHPESQGALERFHQTLKSMLKKYCHQSSSDWDEGLPLMLFAVRETVQQSLGYSPFELLYGRQIRGPLKVLKEQWYQEAPQYPNQTVNQFLDKLKNQLYKVRSIALENLKVSQHQMKAHFDKKTKVRKFNPGDEVLLLLPVPGTPLSLKFQGPYVVSHRLDKQNYVVLTPDRRKDSRLVHINLMKEYVRRKPTDALERPVSCLVQSPLTVEPNIREVDTSALKSNSALLADPTQCLGHLDGMKRTSIIRLFEKYPSVFSDKPGLCTTITHDIELLSNAPSYPPDPVPTKPPQS